MLFAERKGDLIFTRRSIKKYVKSQVVLSILTGCWVYIHQFHTSVYLDSISLIIDNCICLYIFAIKYHANKICEYMCGRSCINTDWLPGLESIHWLLWEWLMWVLNLNPWFKNIYGKRIDSLNSTSKCYNCSFHGFCFCEVWGKVFAQVQHTLGWWCSDAKFFSPSCNKKWQLLTGFLRKNWKKIHLFLKTERNIKQWLNSQG